MRLMIASLLLICSQAQAKDFGLYGHDFEIAEPNMLSEITSQVRALEDKGKIDAINQDFIKRVKKHILEPNPLSLKKVKETVSYPYYPSVTLNEDITDANNQVLIAKGTSINALDKMPGYFPYWVFVDGRDVDQMHWVRNEIKNRINYKIILTGGKIKKASSFLNHRVYFDQEGKLTQKLGIKHVPAVVERKSNALLITEHNIEGNKDA